MLQLAQSLILSLRGSLGYSPSVPSLPTELIIKILEMLHFRDLNSILYACRRFQQIAEPILYRRVHLRAFPVRTIIFYTTILARPELAKCVVSLDACQLASYTSKDWPVFQMTLEALEKEAMKRLVNLQELTFEAYGRDVRYVCSQELLQIIASSKMTLQCFICRQPPLRDDLNRAVGCIAQSQHSITHLELPPDIPSVQDIIADCDLPNLSSLVAGFQVIPDIVPGRPVNKVSVIVTSSSFVDKYDEVLESIARSRVTVRSLSLVISTKDDLDGWAEGGQLMSSVFRHLGRLTELCLQARIVSLAWSNLVDELPLHISQSEALVFISFQRCLGFSIDSFRAYDADHSKTEMVLSRWSNACPTLNRLIYPNGCEWNLCDGEWRGGCGGDTNCLGDVLRVQTKATSYEKDLAEEKWWKRREPFA